MVTDLQRGAENYEFELARRPGETAPIQTADSPSPSHIARLSQNTNPSRSRTESTSAATESRAARTT